jgi:hypothetical protein
VRTGNPTDQTKNVDEQFLLKQPNSQENLPYFELYSKKIGHSETEIGKCGDKNMF